MKSWKMMLTDARTSPLGNASLSHCSRPSVGS
jgi:hypothetical protein